MMKRGAKKGSKENEENSSDQEDVKQDYDELCRQLNMDVETAETAWQSFIETKDKYTLEGSQIHWLACALWVACRNSTLPTVGQASTTVQGNGVSLTRLLRSSKVSLIEFFSKSQKWADMSNLKVEFRQKIDLLERNFAVSNVIFKKYGPIFVSLFKDPANDPPKINRSRKQKKPPCTPSEVFDFCWNLFIRVKALCPDISDDLVNSYHLLLSCVDHIYACAVTPERRTDLLNEKFQGMAQTIDGRPCVVDALCTMHDGIIKEVKAIREHWWRRRIRELFENRVLKGDSDTLTGLLEPAYFESNVKSVRKEYEAYVLSIGEYDERVFLGDDAEEDIGTPANTTGTDIPEMTPEGLNREIQGCKESGSRLIPMTPLSGKHLTKDKEGSAVITPVSSSTNLVARLWKLMKDRENIGPSAKLTELFDSIPSNGDLSHGEMIEKRVKDLGEIFISKYTTPNVDHPGSHEPIARKRLQMGESLYYKNLETILIKEKTKNKPFSNLLEQDIFHRVLFACCLEIVIFSYNSPSRTFPWILNSFELKDFDFYKVIEVIIRAEEWLPREIVKHLQSIEEQILESRAWTSTSPLWDAIERDPNGVPGWEDVSLPNAGGGGGSLIQDVTQSPVSHLGRPFSVKSPMAGDRFKSPVVTALARRQLAFDGTSGLTVTSPIKAGQSILASPQKPVVQSPTKFHIIQPTDNVTLESELHKSKRTGSLALFFRKVYTCANSRLEHLCHGLNITDETFRRKIWTTFEYVLKEQTDMMKDRHMDQILMCSMYIIWKIIFMKKENKNEGVFNKIINQYKKQPQAEKHVYESVLIQDEKEDLIGFYNAVFLKRVKDYIKRYHGDGAMAPLSPMPKMKNHPPPSPIRKVSDSHPVYIRPLKVNPQDEVVFQPKSPHRPLCYSFSRSPAKDLAAINEWMRTEVQRKSRVGKRLLTDDQGSEENSEVQPPAKMQLIQLPIGGATGAMNARLSLVMADRGQND